jgi:hypothetical protein
MKHCKRGHELIERASNRQCKICKREDDRRYLKTSKGRERVARYRYRENKTAIELRIRSKKEILNDYTKIYPS